MAEFAFIHPFLLPFETERVGIDEGNADILPKFVFFYGGALIGWFVVRG